MSLLIAPKKAMTASAISTKETHFGPFEGSLQQQKDGKAMFKAGEMTGRAVCVLQFISDGYGSLEKKEIIRPKSSSEVY